MIVAYLGSGSAHLVEADLLVYLLGADGDQHRRQEHHQHHQRQQEVAGQHRGHVTRASRGLLRDCVNFADGLFAALSTTMLPGRFVP